MKNYAQKRITLMTCLVLLMIAPAVSAQDHQLFTEVLGDYVDAGLVKYEGICQDERLGQYIGQLSGTDPEQLPSRNDKIAFWINVYNAFTLKVVCDNYPIKSMNDLNPGGLIISVALKRTVWDKKFVTINGEETTLKAVEHDILWPEFKEPRAHFAIACGAIACAPLSAEAYEGDQLDQQLDEQARRFLNDERYNSFKVDKKRAYLSNILNWNERYFGNDRYDMLRNIAQFLPEETAEEILSDPKQWKIKWNKYELTLNDQK